MAIIELFSKEFFFTMIRLIRDFNFPKFISLQHHRLQKEIARFVVTCKKR